MKRRLIFTAQAEREIEAIGDHIAIDNPMRAFSFTRELRAACKDILSFPERHALVSRQSGIRRRVHRRYLIFYRIADDRVEIIHVLHGAIDYRAILFPEGDLLPP